MPFEFIKSIDAVKEFMSKIGSYRRSDTTPVNPESERITGLENLILDMKSGNRNAYDGEFGRWVEELSFPTEEFPRADSPALVSQAWEARMDDHLHSGEAMPLPSYLLYVHDLIESDETPKDLKKLPFHLIVRDPQSLINFSLQDAIADLSGSKGAPKAKQGDDKLATTKIATARRYYQISMDNPLLQTTKNNNLLSILNRLLEKDNK